MPQLSFQGQKLFFSTTGTGPALLFLHGFCEDSRMWDAFVAHFQKKYQVVRVDLPGFGQSEPLSGTTIREMAGAVRAVVKELKLPPFVLAGHSMGGYIALAYAQAWPADIRAMAMIHSHPYEDDAEKKENRLKSADFVMRHGSDRYVAQMIPGLFAPDFAEKNRSIIKQLIAQASLYPPEGIADALRAMYQRPDRSEVLRRASFPVLFLIGTEDQAIPAELSKQQTILPPSASIHYLEGVGHMGMFEASEETIEILEEFLRDLGLEGIERD